MNKFKNWMLLILLSVFTYTVQAQSNDDKKIMMDVEEAIDTLLAADPSMQEFFDKSVGYVVFPNVGKAGFIVGGASGNGVVYEKGDAIGMAHLTKVNVGLQAGAEMIIEAIFFETDNELEEFKKGKFKFDSGYSATAVKKGQSKRSGYSEGVAVFTHTKGGLMAEVSVGGQKFKFKPFK